jgi:hypothetical protein
VLHVRCLYRMGENHSTFWECCIRILKSYKQVVADAILLMRDFSIRGAACHFGGGCAQVRAHPAGLRSAARPFLPMPT